MALKRYIKRPSTTAWPFYMSLRQPLFRESKAPPAIPGVCRQRPCPHLPHSLPRRSSPSITMLKSWLNQKLSAEHNALVGFPSTTHEVPAIQQKYARDQKQQRICQRLKHPYFADNDHFLRRELLGLGQATQTRHATAHDTVRRIKTVFWCSGKVCGVDNAWTRAWLVIKQSNQTTHIEAHLTTTRTHPHIQIHTYLKSGGIATIRDVRGGSAGNTGHVELHFERVACSIHHITGDHQQPQL